MSDSITLNVDPCNPGQFFACCGLLELAHRITGHAQGWFENLRFHLKTSLSLKELVDQVLNASIESQNKDDDKAPPLLLKGECFLLRIDWWNDTYAGGSTFKTWAGQQKVESILRKQMEDLKSMVCDADDLSNLLHGQCGTGAVPFYFNSITGSYSSSLDVGYSIDAISGNQQTRQVPVSLPATEVFALCGLQRFRPQKLGRDFIYHIWSEPCCPLLASMLQHIEWPTSQHYAFKLLYRTKYLKSFLTAQPLN